MTPRIEDDAEDRPSKARDIRRLPSCTFCRILAGELAWSPVLESDLVFAFLDIRPANPGHTLVVPRRHVESFTDLAHPEVEQLALAGQRIAGALKEHFAACAAITLSLADGEAAGQDVPHTHLHVIPRQAGDRFGWRAAGELQERAALDAIAERLRAAVATSPS